MFYLGALGVCFENVDANGRSTCEKKQTFNAETAETAEKH
jgi:hypothetical protein